MSIESVRPLRYVCVDDSVFLGREVIQVECRSKSHLPIDRPECRVTLEEVEAKPKSLRQKELPALAKEWRGIRLGRALVRRCRQPAAIERRRTAPREVKEGPRAQNIRQHRVIALVLVPVERVIPMSEHIRRAHIVRVPPVIRHRRVPAVRLRQIHHVLGRQAKHRRHDRPVVDAVPAQLPIERVVDLGRSAGNDRRWPRSQRHWKLHLNAQHLARPDVNISSLERRTAWHGECERIVCRPALGAPGRCRRHRTPRIASAKAHTARAWTRAKP